MTYTTETYVGTKVKEKIRMFKKAAVTCLPHYGDVSYTERFLTQQFARTIDTINCNNIASLFKVVQHVVATNVALKIVCRRHVIYILIFYATMLR